MDSKRGWRELGGGPGWFLVATLASSLVLLDRLSPVARAAVTSQSEDRKPRFEEIFLLHSSGDEFVWALKGLTLRDGEQEVRAEAALLWTSAHDLNRLLQSSSQDPSDAVLEDPLRVEAVFPAAPGRSPLGPPPRSLSRILQERFKGLREIYLEGHVLWRDATGSSVFADHLYFDLVENRGVIADATLVAEGVPGPDGETVSLQVRARRLRTLDPSKLEALDAVFSTCTFGEPHYHLDTERLVLRHPEGTPFALDDVDAVQVESSGSSLHTGFLPGIPLPPFSFTASRDGAMPLRSVRVGRSTKLGVFARTTWGTEFQDLGQSVHEKLGIDAPFAGDFELDIDEFSRRGPALGPSVEYESPGLYFGSFDTYFLHDRRDEDHSRLDRAEPGGMGDPFRFDVEQPLRGRVHTENRLFLADHLRLDAEAYYLSDEGFRREYFERDFKEEKEPESYGHLVFQDGTLRARALYRNRLNDFDTQLDSLPRLSLEQLAFPVLRMPWTEQPSYLLVSHLTEVANLRRHPADGVTTSSARIDRADSLVELTLPLDVGPFGLRPFLSGSATGWDESADEGESLGRVQSTSGVRLELPLHRDFLVSWPKLSIDGLRHVAIADVSYENLWLSTRRPDDFEQLDAVDARTKLERYLVGLRQRLSTWRGNDVQTFLDLDIEVPLYPDEDRDNLIDTDSAGQPKGRTAGPLHFDLWYQPGFQTAWLARTTLRLQADADLYDRSFEAWESAVVIAPIADFSALVSYRVRRGLSRVLTAGADLRLTEKWAMGAFQQIDLRESENLEHRLRLRRYGHDFYLDLEFDRDLADRNTSVALRITPIFSRSRTRERDLGELGSSPILGVPETR